MHDGERLEINGAPGDYVSLLPLTWHVSGVTTIGLRYTLTTEMLEQGPARGLSNELTTDSATVQIGRGRLAVVHTHRFEVADR
jgi:thiamine pyrophosphokinase